MAPKKNVPAIMLILNCVLILRPFATIAFSPMHTQFTGRSVVVPSNDKKRTKSQNFRFSTPSTSLWSSTKTGINSVANNGYKRTHLFEQTQRYYHQHPKSNEWIERSLEYYTKITREERRRRIGQVKNYESQEYQDDFVHMAKKHYYALTKIRDRKFHHAECIYRKIIDEIVNQKDEEDCDHAQLAVTTLLLALLTQRMGDSKKTRSVFLNFFRIVTLENAHEGKECACSAKVLQAYALFEMKQGNRQKSLEIVKMALQFDSTLEPILQWKQFRDVVEQQKKVQNRVRAKESQKLFKPLV